MSKHIYVVSLKGGRSHSSYSTFYTNVSGDLNAQTSDYGAINNICLISHRQDADTIHMLCSDGIKKKNDVTVEEITKATLSDNSSHHRVHAEFIEKYYLRHDTYPNIK